MVLFTKPKAPTRRSLFSLGVWLLLRRFGFQQHLLQHKTNITASCINLKKNYAR